MQEIEPDYSGTDFESLLIVLSKLYKNQMKTYGKKPKRNYSYFSNRWTDGERYLWWKSRKKAWIIEVENINHAIINKCYLLY